MARFPTVPHGGPPAYNTVININTPHRPSIRIVKIPIKNPKTVSTRRTQRSRPRSDDAMLHGMNNAQKTASPVPTQFARNEFEISPRTKSAKLVVIPHDGHGISAIRRKLQAGIPSV